MVPSNYFYHRITRLVLISLMMIAVSAQAKPSVQSSSRVCRLVDVSDWAEVSQSLKGMELVAFASWCSSCREKLMSTKTSPDRFVFISVFEEPEQSLQAMNRLGLTSPCIYGPELVSILGIKALPWSQRI